jgi:hypothetical protein
MLPIQLAEGQRHGRIVRTLGLVICIAVVCMSWPRLHRVRCGELEVQYGHGATRAEAQAIVHAFDEAGVFAHDPGREQRAPEWAMGVRRDAGRRVVEVTRRRVEDSDRTAPQWWDPAVRPEICVELLRILSRGPLGDEPVDFAVRDEDGQLSARVPWEHRIRKLEITGRPTVAYRLGASESEARRLAHALERHTAVAEPATLSAVRLRSAGARHVVELALDIPGNIEVVDPAVLAAMRRTEPRIRALSGTLSDEVFGGQPVEVTLRYEHHALYGLDSISP